MIGLVIAGASFILLCVVKVIQEILRDIDREKALDYELEQMQKIGNSERITHGTR